MAEFWTRWHISLSTWFRDYLYIPMGGSRVSMPRRWLNLMTTFLVSGLWHGASWNFVIWGGLNGAYQIGEVTSKNERRDLWHRLGMVQGHWLCNLLGAGITFGLICLTWVFFRAATFADAAYIISAGRHSIFETMGDMELLRLNQPAFYWLLAGLALATLLSIEWIQRRGPLRPRLARRPVLEALLGAGLIAAIILAGNFESKQQFIYFQF